MSLGYCSLCKKRYSLGRATNMELKYFKHFCFNCCRKDKDNVDKKIIQIKKQEKRDNVIFDRILKGSQKTSNQTIKQGYNKEDSY